MDAGEKVGNLFRTLRYVVKNEWKWVNGVVQKLHDAIIWLLYLTEAKSCVLTES